MNKNGFFLFCFVCLTTTTKKSASTKVTESSKLLVLCRVDEVSKSSNTTV